jgi:nucleoside-diphosphate-sugar epimerase
MKLFITGAAGFLGQAVVTEALRRGHHVHAAVRPATDVTRLPYHGHERLQYARVDLRAKAGLPDSLTGVDAVIHLAAAKSGDYYAQMAGTVVTTENLLDAMTQARVTRLIAISTFSVYEILRRWHWALLDESSPLVKVPEERDDYSRTKLIQEKLIRDHAAAHHFQLTILRPGVIFGKDNLWNGFLGMELSPTTWIRTGAWAKIPLTYVENCAEAILLACENKNAINQTYNVVDDDLPTQRRYGQLIQQRLNPRPRIIPVAWSVMRTLSRSLWLFNKLFLAGRAKVPSIFVPHRLHARAKPLRYSNRKIREQLAWRPRYALIEALDRAVARTTLRKNATAPQPQPTTEDLPRVSA